jgi:hypothetical protein
MVLASGCAENRQYFRPTERVYGRTIQGHGEAIYELVGAFGPFGEAKVWSPGAFREEDSTVLHVNVDLHNTSGVPIEVDPQQLRADPVRVGSELLRDVPPLEKQRLTVAPGAFGRIKLRYLLPPQYRPGHLSGFGLRWQVKNGPQSYAQVTPFIEEGRYGGGYGYGHYRGPGYGYGYGVGYGFCSPYDPLCYPRGYYGYGGVGYGIGGPLYHSPSFNSRPDARPPAVIRTR